MAQAARDGSTPLLTQKIQDADLKALWLLKRGIRHAYDLKFSDMAQDVFPLCGDDDGDKHRCHVWSS